MQVLACPYTLLVATEFYCNIGLLILYRCILAYVYVISKLNTLNHSKNTENTSSGTIWEELLHHAHC